MAELKVKLIDRSDITDNSDLINNPKFIKTFNNIPYADLEPFLKFVKPTKDNMTDVKMQIAILYWQNPACNSNCKNRYGKKSFMRCSKCKNKFCSTACHAKWHNSLLNKKCSQIEENDYKFNEITEKEGENLDLVICPNTEIPKKLIKCTEESCRATELCLFRCQKCYLCYYCSEECRIKDEEMHSKRCCNLNGPADYGPMRISFLQQPLRK